jgi:hypothetical protein
VEEKKENRRLPLSSIIAIVCLIVLFYWFFSGEMYGFYASIVFLFYSWTHSMWISVVLLGVFQTLLLIPFRIIRLLDFRNIRDFQTETVEHEDTGRQESFLGRQFRQGNWTLTLYLLDFSVQLTTYITIGKLFLTDFYTKALNPHLLYSFVNYPNYPLRDRFFKIPYPTVTKTIDLGVETVVYVWLMIIIAQLIISMIRSMIARKDKAEKNSEQPETHKAGKVSGRHMVVYGVILFIFSYFLVRNFPITGDLRIFTGDVARPNRTFNTVTALATFFTLMWFGVNDILKKGKIAKSMGIPQRRIDKTQMSLFKGKITNATFIGMGAYFITNQIPCAFELSIFTLEVISLFSPFTLDKLILNKIPQKEYPDTEEKEKHEVEKQFLAPTE